ncbi:hypothetical protein D3Y57_00860 (plasmid) [Sphingomonas paeninsulae]|uniref:Uncharacterized protein n=1 Tax=Sphingomonas paeninsulae TaxID=2319844 RepID=A0A494T5R2_SPHPE|nr:hypothetical protein [Sphingomonas paeninsulae]AYJ84677.1 hypothetical protein D3Y57_00860 [Sphingomonas paeninsulae]
MLQARIDGHAHCRTEATFVLNDDTAAWCLLPLEIGLKEVEEILRYLFDISLIVSPAMFKEPTRRTENQSLKLALHLP